jgi:hypothetical protein
MHHHCRGAKDLPGGIFPPLDVSTSRSMMDLRIWEAPFRHTIFADYKNGAFH